MGCRLGVAEGAESYTMPLFPFPCSAGRVGWLMIRLMYLVGAHTCGSLTTRPLGRSGGGSGSSLPMGNAVPRCPLELSSGYYWVWREPAILSSGGPFGCYWPRAVKRISF